MFPSFPEIVLKTLFSFQGMDGGKCVRAIVCKLDMHKKVFRRSYIAILAVDNYRGKKIGLHRTICFKFPWFSIDIAVLRRLELGDACDRGHG